MTRTGYTFEEWQQNRDPSTFRRHFRHYACQLMTSYTCRS